MAYISSEISQEAKQNKKLVASGRAESDTSIRKLHSLSEELRVTQGLLFEKQNSREKSVGTAWLYVLTRYILELLCIYRQRQVQDARQGSARAKSHGRPSTRVH